MFARTSRALLLLAPLAVMSACQSPDVGQTCELSWATDRSDAPLATEVKSDYVEFSAANGCENLVCIISPVGAGSTYDRTRGVGYCSKPCVSNGDCYQSETGLVCRPIVLDQDFLATLDPETRKRYLGDIQYSSYCAVER